MRYEGAVNSMMRRMRRRSRRTCASTTSASLQSSLLGVRRPRVRSEALGVRIAGKNIAEATALSVETALEYFEHLGLKGSEATIVPSC